MFLRFLIAALAFHFASSPASGGLAYYRYWKEDLARRLGSAPTATFC